MNNIKCYYTHDSYLNSKISEIRRYIENNESWLGEDFLNEKDWVPSIVYNLGSWAECYSSEIPRKNKIVDVYSVINDSMNVVCSFYCEKYYGYMEMFYGKDDYNMCTFKKLCFIIFI